MPCEKLNVHMGNSLSVSSLGTAQIEWDIMPLYIWLKTDRMGYHALVYLAEGRSNGISCPCVSG